jgi:peptidoglycan DL-endopeptidase CwlO
VAGALSGKAVALTVGGFVLLWSGIKGQTLGVTLQYLLHGQLVPRAAEAPPSLGVNDNASPSATGVAVTTTTSTIANDALKYQGHAYLYGGAPGPSGAGPWDCSSFVNWVLGHDLGMTLPGSTSPGYSGTSHGPSTLSYLAWSGARTVGHSASASEPGDLVVGATHMGIATGDGNYISAHDPAEGTTVSPVSGFPDPVFQVRRIVIGNPEA